MTTTYERRIAKYSTAYLTLGNILQNRDPMGIAFCDNYNLEVDTILPLLKREHTVEEVCSIVYEQFCYWFDDAAGEKSGYTCIAEDMYQDVLPILTEKA